MLYWAASMKRYTGGSLRLFGQRRYPLTTEVGIVFQKVLRCFEWNGFPPTPRRECSKSRAVSPSPLRKGRGRGEGLSPGTLAHHDSGSLPCGVGQAERLTLSLSPHPHSLSPSEGEREDALLSPLPHKLRDALPPRFIPLKTAGNHPERVAPITPPEGLRTGSAPAGPGHCPIWIPWVATHGYSHFSPPG